SQIVTSGAPASSVSVRLTQSAPSLAIPTSSVSCRSSPAQKTGPFPLKIRTRVAGSTEYRPIASNNSRSNAMLNAFRRAGRFSVRATTPGRTVSARRISSLIVHPCSIGCEEPDRHLDRHFKDRLTERLPLGVDPRGLAEHPPEYEIQRAQVRQLITLY